MYTSGSKRCVILVGLVDGQVFFWRVLCRNQNGEVQGFQAPGNGLESNTKSCLHRVSVSLHASICQPSFHFDRLTDSLY